MTMTNGYPNNATIQFGMEGLQGFTVTNNRRFVKTGAKSANCWIQYNQAANANTPPTYSTAQGVIANTGAAEQAMLTYLRTVC
jgi:hypothetical protein